MNSAVAFSEYQIISGCKTWAHVNVRVISKLFLSKYLDNTDTILMKYEILSLGI